MFGLVVLPNGYETQKRLLQMIGTRLRLGTTARIVMIPGANCDGNNVCKLPDEPPHFTRLFHPGLELEHVEQITGNTNEIVAGRLLPPKPAKAEVEIGCQKKLHGLGKCSSKVVEMSSL